MASLFVFPVHPRLRLCFAAGIELKVVSCEGSILALVQICMGAAPYGVVAIYTSLSRAENMIKSCTWVEAEAYFVVIHARHKHDQTCGCETIPKCAACPLSQKTRLDF